RPSVLARSLEFSAEVAEVARRPQRVLRAKRAMRLCVLCNLCDLRAEQPADRRTRAMPAWRHPLPQGRAIAHGRRHLHFLVMPGLGPAIHVLAAAASGDHRSSTVFAAA